MTPDLAPDEAPDAAIARAERRLALLEELTEIGMELARALRPGLAEEETGSEKSAPRRDAADLYSSLSRAIRLTLTLEAKTDEALANLKAGLPVSRETVRKAAEDRARAPRVQHYQRIEDLLAHVIDAEAETPEQHDELLAARDQRMACDEAYFDFEAWPLRVIVERLCHDLCLHPDWSKWTGEGWIDEAEPFSRPLCSPFNRPSPRPYDTDLGWRPPAGPSRAGGPYHVLE